LTGDKNQLHIDPKAAKSVGFDRPIIHGLCTYGYTARAIYEKYGGNDPANIKKFAGRFTSHVFPGETLIVDMWHDAKNNKVYSEVRTKERKSVALKAVMEFHPNNTAKL
jgi:acyl dehydratase